MDWIFENGRVFRGTGVGIQSVDVGVQGEYIEVVGDLTEVDADRRVDLEGRVLSPGFIDLHSHSDLSLVEDPRGISKVTQGVTTEVTGNCSMSPAPVRPSNRREVAEQCSYMAGDVDWQWESFSEYLDVLRASTTAMNVSAQVGHGTLRTFVVGLEDRPATKDEIKEMKARLREALKAGACGLSTGLMYPPSSYANQNEITALCDVVAEEDALYSTHMRNEGWKMLDALDETLDVTRRTGVRTQVSHLKAAGPPKWGNVRKAVERIEDCRDEGYQVTFDVYPYTRGSTQLRSILPPFMTEGGIDDLLDRLADPGLRPAVKKAMEEGTEEWDSYFGPGALTPEQIEIGSVESAENQHWTGKSLAEIADARDENPWGVLCDILLEEEGGGLCILDLLDESDVRYLLSVPWGTVASDGLAIAPEGHWREKRVHPRYYGCFPRVISRYVKQEDVLSLEEALRIMTIQPARQLGLPERGQIVDGSPADLVVLDPEEIDDRATFASPHQRSKGIRWLFVGGDPIVERAELNEL